MADAADLIERLTAENAALREGASLGKAKRKNMMDMTPVCEWCGKVAPVDTKLSTLNWTVYRTK